MFSSSEVIFSRLPERFCFWGNQDEFWELSLKLQKTGIRTSMWASWLDIISPKKQNKKQPSSWAVVSCYFIFHPWVFVSLCLASLRCRICFVSGFSVVTASHVLLIFVSLQSFKHLVCTDGHVILVYRPLISDRVFLTDWDWESCFKLEMCQCACSLRICSQVWWTVPDVLKLQLVGFLDQWGSEFVFG